MVFSNISINIGRIIPLHIYKNKVAIYESVGL
jgi:hypothetical protein